MVLKSKEFDPVLVIPINGAEYFDGDNGVAIAETGVEGSSYNNPGSSCYAVKRKYAYKRSGYYWILNHCQ